MCNYINPASVTIPTFTFLQLLPIINETGESLSFAADTLKAILDAPGVRGTRVTQIFPEGNDANGDLTDLFHPLILNEQITKEPFHVLDLGVVVSLMNQWAKALPDIQPFYAVKCNPNRTLLGAMAALGSNFDCASRAEIETILSLGVLADRIIFANPCKVESHIKYAAGVGVNLTTLDSMAEIGKICRLHPKCRLLLRISPPEESNSNNRLHSKFGALPDEIAPLLRAAQASRLSVMGVSFHIGSGGADSKAFHGAIRGAKSVVNLASHLGMPPMTVLDIGGGFESESDKFEKASDDVKTALSRYFRGVPHLVLIGEPGRYIAKTAFTLVANIIGNRIRRGVREYWINDGICGSLNNIWNDHAVVSCEALACSTVFGPTCDSIDIVLRNYLLPELQLNDWLVFPNMGAYTLSCGSSFNGFSTSSIPIHVAFKWPYSPCMAMPILTVKN